MIHVLDASLIIAAVVGEEQTEAARAVVAKADRGSVTPPHFSLEVANALTMKYRRNLLTRDQRATVIDILNDLNIAPDDEKDRFAVLERTLALADAHGLTLYDAAYLELAIRKSATLGSLDNDLRKAAKVAGVQVAP